MTDYKLYDNPLKPDALYWTEDDMKKTLSYGCTISTLTSPRNVGKSYAAMQIAKRSLDKGGSVAWGRYNKTELAASLRAWSTFNPDLQPVKSSSDLKIFEDQCTGGRLSFFTWSRSQNLKGIDEPFSFIICDEFVPERYTEKTRLDTEFSDWSSVYLSLARSYNPKVIMLSNCIYWINPFFLAWNIIPFGKGKTLISKDTFRAEIDGAVVKTSRRVASENIGMSRAMIERTLKETAISFGSSSDMQHYYDNATKAEYTTIGKCPEPGTPLDPIQIMSDGYYMGTRQYDDRLYVCKIRPDHSKDTLVSEPAYIELNKRQFRNLKYADYYEQLFNAGNCVFDSSETLTHYLRWLRHMRMRV